MGKAILAIIGRVAMKSNLRGNFSVAVKSPSGEPIPLPVGRMEAKR